MRGRARWFEAARAELAGQIVERRLCRARAVGPLRPFPLFPQRREAQYCTPLSAILRTARDRFGPGANPVLLADLEAWITVIERAERARESSP